MTLVTLDDIRAAARAISGVAVRTPLVPCPWADPDRPLWVKPESLQPIGAFKIRGARNAIARLAPEVRQRGVVTHSSGNHGQAVGYVARALGVPAVIVVPDAAPAVKVDAMRALGAEVVLVPGAERESRTAALASARGLAVIPPYDHPDVIAGQGTIGLEIVADLSDVDLVLVPLGGGGLASGVGVAVKALAPHARVVGVEPELAADTAESLRTGRIVPWSTERTYRTSADGLRSTSPSELTFAHLRAVLDGVVTVSEEEIGAAVGVLARQAHLVAEPSGAVATAAYLYHRDELPIGRTVAVLTGGNIDPAVLAALL